MSESDREIVQRVRAGDRDGFGELVSRYQARLFGLVLMMVRRRQAAEDVTQDTFVRAFTHLDQYDASRPLYPWLAAIAVRLAQNSLRDHARLAGRESISAQEQPRGIEAEGLDEIVADERRHQLWTAVAALSSGERTVVLLHYRDEMTVGDIAQVLGVTCGTVKTLLFRARRHLRERLSAGLFMDEASR